MSEAAAPSSMSGASRDMSLSSVFPWWLVLIQGIVALLVGVFLFMSPARTTVFLVLILGWYWLISGVFQLISLFWDRTLWGWRVASGLLGLIAGAYIVGAPIIGAVIVVGVVTLIIGINGVIIGVIDIVKAFQGGGWGIGILGALSFIIGLAIVFNLPAFMMALPWVWGLLAVVAGILGIIGAFQLRGVQKA